MKYKKIFAIIWVIFALTIFGTTACSTAKDDSKTDNGMQEKDELPLILGIDEQQPEKAPEPEAPKEEAIQQESEEPAPVKPVTPVTPPVSPPPPQLQFQGDTGNQELNGLCDDVLNSVITSGMDERQKLKAVYDWVETKIRYSGSTTIGNWRTEAIKILKSRKGNCVAYCYVSEALLTRLGVENVEIQTDNQDHFWNMVKYNGNWYHWDTTQGWGTERFLWTTSQIKSYTYKNICYSPFDESKYPTTP